MALTELEDAELLAAVTHAAANERSVTVQLIVLLSELDARRLYLREGCASLFTYCTQVLHLSEHAAYGRITAARAARRFPNLLTLLEEGAITLTTVGLIAPYLTLQNADSLLTIARHQSKREVEQIVAALRPQPPQPSAVRRCPLRRQSSVRIPRAQVINLSPTRAHPRTGQQPATRIRILWTIRG